MFEFSRAIYREIAADIVEDPHARFSTHPHPNHERVLRACESAIERLATDRHYFAKPTRTLFNDIRAYFPMSAPSCGCCASSSSTCARPTRSSSASRRAAMTSSATRSSAAPAPARAPRASGSRCPHNGYCPSHQHLAETEEIDLAA